ncbi:MAG: carbohydrate kinase [Sphingobacteriales bacterium]|nr:carbohydrate kinase [Sphingobacteriales bacterium]
MNKILCIGEALIDMICTDKGKSLAEGDNFLKKPGGAPTNVAAAIAALGGQVELAAKVGVDPFGEHLVDVMKGFGVGTTCMLRDAEHFTTFAFVSLMENGERDFYFNRGADGQLSKEEIAQISLEETGLIHFGSATAFLPGPLQEAYTWLLQEARNRKCFVSFDPNYRQLLFRNNKASFIEQSWHFLENCDFFKVSDEEALLLTGAADLEKAAQQFLEKTSAVFAITLGKDGTLLGREGRTTMIESVTVNPVDTTGAGDAFVGAVLFQLIAADPARCSQSDWERIIRNANRAGARTCEYLGAMEAFKHLNKNIFK